MHFVVDALFCEIVCLSSTFTMDQKVLDILSQSPQNSFSTLQLAKACGAQTRAAVNPTLYALQKAGKIEQVTSSPPTWRVVVDDGDNRIRSSSRMLSSDRVTASVLSEPGGDGRDAIGEDSAAVGSENTDLSAAWNAGIQSAQEERMKESTCTSGSHTSLTEQSMQCCTPDVDTKIDEESIEMGDCDSKFEVKEETGEPEAAASSSMDTQSVDADVIRFISGKVAPCSVLEIGKAVGLPTRSQMLPILSRLEEEGLIVRRQDRPPLWSVCDTGVSTNQGAGDSAQAPASSASQQQQSSSLDAEDSHNAEVVHFLSSLSGPATSLEIGQAVGLPTRTQINPVLDKLAEDRIVLKCHDRPPLWTLPRAASRDLDQPAATPQVSYQPSQRMSGSDSNSDLQQKVLTMLQTKGKACSTLEVAHAVGLQTRADVNPTLYGLKRAGSVEQVQERPPMWKAMAMQASVTARVPTATQSSTSCSNSEAEILKFLQQKGSPCSSLELGRVVGLGTRSAINPTLYSMAERHLIRKSQDNPPMWALVHSAGGVSSPSVHSKSTIDGILKYLSSQRSPSSSLEVGNAVGLATRQQINPILEALCAEGQVIRTQEMPPMWKLSSNEPMAKRPVPASVEPLSRHPPPVQFPLQHQPAQPHALGVTSSHPSQAPAVLPAVSTSLLSAMNKNPVSAVMEHAQANGISATFNLASSHGQSHRQKFTIVAQVGTQRFTGTATNKKDAKRFAAEAALRAIQAGQLSTSHSQSYSGPPQGGVSSGKGNLLPPAARPSGHRPGLAAGSGMHGTVDVSLGMPQRLLSARGAYPDMIATMSHQLFDQLALTCVDSDPGRKVLAAFVMVTADQEARVVALGTGTRCVTGQHLSLEGLAVNDSHAEIVARRSLIRFLYSQVLEFHSGSNATCLEPSATRGVLKLKRSISFHLYISTAPCGDGAVFSSRDAQHMASQPETCSQHAPLFEGKQQGVLRTKVSDRNFLQQRLLLVLKFIVSIVVDWVFNVESFWDIGKLGTLWALSLSDELLVWASFVICGRLTQLQLVRAVSLSFMTVCFVHVSFFDFGRLKMERVLYPLVAIVVCKLGMA